MPSLQHSHLLRVGMQADPVGEQRAPGQLHTQTQAPPTCQMSRPRRRNVKKQEEAAIESSYQLHYGSACRRLASRFQTPLLINRPENRQMREVISIHLGQCGVQIGNACWELYCLVRLRALEPNRTHRARPSCEPALACPIRARYSLSQRERCVRHPTATRTRIGAASSACLAHHPIPTCPANTPARDDLLSVSPLLHPLSHVSSPYVPCPAGARHPARRPDALGQDDRRR
jgi:hypothetical protein